MSNFEELRKKQGNIWLNFSFFFFTLSICLIWGAFFYPLYLPPSIGAFIVFILSASVAYDEYTCVTKEQIHNSYSAKLRKIKGICQLVGAFIFLALAISTIWVIFVFSEISSSILPIFVIAFGVFTGAFYGFSIAAKNNFIEIGNLLNKEEVQFIKFIEK